MYSERKKAYLLERESKSEMFTLLLLIVAVSRFLLLHLSPFKAKHSYCVTRFKGVTFEFPDKCTSVDDEGISFDAWMVWKEWFVIWKYV